MLSLAPLSAAVLLASSLVGATPLPWGFGKPHSFAPKLNGCDLSRAVLKLPSTAAAANMSIPAGQKPAFVLLGKGVQNYTCTAGVYTTNMAVAELFDASCSVGTPLYSTLPKLALAAGIRSPFPKQITALIGSLRFGDHYFQKLSATAASANPVFDLRATKKGDYVAVSKVTSVASPVTPASTVAWVQLKNVEGSLAQSVFRVETAGGQPPATCTKEGEVKTVPYAAMYWFFK